MNAIVHSVEDRYVNSFSAYEFENLEEAPFDIAAYSRMKFGSGVDAKKLGYDLAESFASSYMDLLEEERCVVIPSPSTSVPVAATVMGWHFYNRLNSMLAARNLPLVQWDRIHRAVTYNDNYAELDLEDRQRLLSDDERFMNTRFCEGKTIIFIDDVVITGTHERKMIHMLENHSMKNDVIMVTYARYMGDRPKIEHELNHCFVMCATSVMTLTKDPEWVPTTRALRLLLEASEVVFMRVLTDMEGFRVEQVYHASIAKEYHKHEPYASNFEILRTRAERIIREHKNL